MVIEVEEPLGEFAPPDSNRLYPELFALHREIHGFSEDLDNLQRLLEIQKRLITAVSDAEREIKAAKSGDIDPKEWQYVRYNFLCLGDSLAFLYIDRFALKQMFFNVDNGNPKQGGGFLSDQTGLAGEVSLLMEAIANGVPAVLCDLTTVLRFGDVCLLGASDPVPIEVKSSKAKDARAKRQKRKIDTLTKFLETDQATDFRGVTGTTFRTEFSSPPRSFVNLLEAAISEAVSQGTSTFEVDQCLKFGVIADGEPDYDSLFSGINPSRTLVNFVNQIKTNMIWGCYVPYALSLSNSDHYEMFVRGEIVIISLLDLADFEAKLSSDGVALTVEADEENIQCRIDFSTLEGDLDAAVFIIGEHMMCRMWTDFLHPSWIVQNSIDTVRNNAEMLALAQTDFIKNAAL